MGVTITRRLRSIITSPRWRLAILISAMLFVGSSASNGPPGPARIRVVGARVPGFNGDYNRKDTGSSIPTIVLHRHVKNPDAYDTGRAFKEWKRKLNGTYWYC